MTSPTPNQTVITPQLDVVGNINDVKHRHHHHNYNNTIATQHYQPQHFQQARTISNVTAGPTTSTTLTTTTAGKCQILSEHVIEHEVTVPRRVVKEQVLERTIVVPEKVLKEDIVEETQRVREKIVEVAKPVTVQRVVEVPDIQYVQKVVEVVERVTQERIKHVPKVEYRERIVEVPKIVKKERIVEVPEIVYKPYQVERVVEVPEIVQEVVVKEVPVPQYVEKPVAEYVTVEVPQNICRNIPTPLEATTTYEFLLPQLKPKYKKVQVPIYAPRFVEVPIPRELLKSDLLQQAEHISAQVNILASQQAPSLCELEKLAEYAKKCDIPSQLSSQNLSSAIEEAWRSGTLSISNLPSPTA